MKRLYCTRTAGYVLWILLLLPVCHGCYDSQRKAVGEFDDTPSNLQVPYKPVKPFPAVIPENVIISKVLNADGGFFLTDGRKEIFPDNAVTFSKLLLKANMEKPRWMQILGSYTVLRLPKEGKLLLCDKDYQCFETMAADKDKGGVVSINYDGIKVFLADESGKMISKKEMKPLASLIKDIPPDVLESLDSSYRFDIFKLQGSVRIAFCMNNICFCTCCERVEWPFGIPRCINQSSCDIQGNCN